MKSIKKQTKKSASSKGARAPTKANSSKTRKSAPVAKALRRYQTTAPRIQNSPNGLGAVNVTHREFVQDVTGQTLFTATSFPINPARDTLFTWLSDLATRYERYQFNRLRFCYEPRCSTATAGSVILAVDYDSSDAAPANKQDVYAYHHTAQSSAWDECIFDVDPAILTSRGPLYSRPGAVPASSDVKLYDLGNLWLCVSGFSGAVVCGELFVEYSVNLRIPQLQSNVQSATYSPTGEDGNIPFGTSPLVLTGLLDATLTGTTLTFNQNWVGLVTVVTTGTDLVSMNNGVGTCTFAVISQTPAVGALTMTGVYSITALRGQTFIPTYAATTVSATSYTFTPVS